MNKRILSGFLSLLIILGTFISPQSVEAGIAPETIYSTVYLRSGDVYSVKDNLNYLPNKAKLRCKSDDKYIAKCSKKGKITARDVAEPSVTYINAQASKGSKTYENLGFDVCVVPQSYTMSAAYPSYSGSSYVELNNNEPLFTDDYLTSQPFEYYSELDSLGRCGTAFANICADLLPTEDRGEIGNIRPSGWHTVNYHELIDGNYLYNRCHLIAFSLAGENANEKNLITGTRYLNVSGMLPFEMKVLDYVKDTGNHVLYRVTPVFEGNNLLATGVIMEARSVEDDGLKFNVFVYNVQPGIGINYADGDSWVEGTAPTPTPEPTPEPTVEPTPSPTLEPTPEPTAIPTPVPTEVSYILNTNTMKFHIPTCSSVAQMSESNKEYSNASRDEIIARGFVPCKRCNP